MEKIKKEIAEILEKELYKYFGPNASEILGKKEKEDLTIVTVIDHLVSKILKEKLNNHKEFSHYAFFSEEDYGELKFPSVILDPIDGTNELIKGRPECVVSLATMNSPEIADSKNYGWLYNPFTGFSLDSNNIFHSHLNRSTQQTLGLVSRSEWNKGYYQNIKSKNIAVVPRGSIAFKLGLLASGACDFVVSLAPKNIWDIAAGTILLNQRGILFYIDGIPVTHLNQVSYNSKLLWCQPSLAPDLIKEFINEK
jgi:myo-inositol-1(or 4)-monophosphatase